MGIQMMIRALIALCFLGLPVLAHASTNFACGDKKSGVDISIEMISATEANLTIVPALVQITNPGKMAPTQQSGVVLITNQAQSGPFPGSPNVRAIETQFYFNFLNETLEIVNGSGQVRATLSCKALN
jgi:hypothetical protein